MLSRLRQLLRRKEPKKSTFTNEHATLPTDRYDNFVAPQNDQFNRQNLRQPLNVGRKEIRLVHIVPSDNPNRVIQLELIQNISLDDIPVAYVALSYAVGSAASPCSVMLNGHRFNVTEPLDHALRELRAHADQRQNKPVWIDQICINQTDYEEKNHQVLLMQQIYKKADAVFISIGRLDNAISTAVMIEIMQQLPFQLGARLQAEPGFTGSYMHAVAQGQRHMTHFYIESLFNPRLREQSQGLLELCKSRYWSRLWVYQEVLLAAHDPVVMLGDRCLPMHVIGTACLLMHEAASNIHTLIEDGDLVTKLGRSFEEIAKEVALRACLGLVRLFSYRTSLPDERRTLSRLLRDTAALECYDPRDRIYSLISFVSTQHQIRPDYRPENTTSQVYIEAAMNCALYDKSLSFLVYVHDERRNLSLDLPSWVPDWGNHAGVTLRDVDTGMEDDLERVCELNSRHCTKDLPAEVTFNTSNSGSSVMKVKLIILDSFEAAMELSHEIKVTALPDGIVRLDKHFFSRSKGEELAQRTQLLFYPDGNQTEWQEAFRETLRFGCNEDLKPVEEEGQDVDSYRSHLLKETAWKSQLRAFGSLRDALRARGYWKFFCLQSGVFGFTVARARASDKICFVIGCRVPVILRPFENEVGFTYVGCAYVQGYMDGFAIDECDRGRLKYEWVEIH